MMKEEQRSWLLTTPRPFSCHHTGLFLLIVPAINMSFFPRVVGKKKNMLWTCYISVAPEYQPVVQVNRPSCEAGNGGMEEVEV